VTQSQRRASTSVIEYEIERAQIRELRLEVLSGPDTGVVLRARTDRVVIGADPDSDLALTDGTVSWRHCEIELGPDAVRVRDLGSSNGTVVDGLSIESIKLDRAATLTLGRTRVRVEPRSDRFALEEVGGDIAAVEPEPEQEVDAPSIDTSVPLRRAREEWVLYFERRYLAEMLEETGQNVTAAARRAEIDRVHMHRLLSRAGLR